MVVHGSTDTSHQSVSNLIMSTFSGFGFLDPYIKHVNEKHALCSLNLV